MNAVRLSRKPLSSLQISAYSSTEIAPKWIVDSGAPLDVARENDLLRDMEEKCMERMLRNPHPENA